MLCPLGTSKLDVYLLCAPLNEGVIIGGCPRIQVVLQNKEKLGKKVQFIGVNEYFEIIFNA